MVNLPSPFVTAPYRCSGPLLFRMETCARSTGAPVTELVTAPERLAGSAAVAAGGVCAVTRPRAAKQRSRHRARQDLPTRPLRRLLFRSDMNIILADHLEVFDD